MNPIVDIVLPIYKPTFLVFRSIDSILAQTYTNWHLYIIDDASNDDSLKRIKEKYASYSDKITYFQFEENKRAAFARNYAIKHGDGKYIALIDQDDQWRQDKLEKQINFMEGTFQYGASHTDVKIFDLHGNYLEEKSIQDNKNRSQIDWENIDLLELSRKMFLKPGVRLASTVIKRDVFEAIGGFVDNYFGAEDWEFWTRLAKNYKIGHLPYPLLIRNIHLNNTGSSMLFERTKGALDYLKILKKDDSYTYLGDLIKQKQKRLLKQQLYEAKTLGKYDFMIKDFIKLLF